MKYSISIVSHNSGKLIASLFQDLCRHLPAQAEILLTINIPEDESYLAHAQGLPLKVIRNLSPLGFGANHNQAFASASGERFVVLNPDVRLPENPWQVLGAAFGPRTAACAPLVVSPAGDMEDSVRRYPSVARLFKRVVLRDRRADYAAPADLRPFDVEWVGGMFIVFDAQCYRAIKGFDTRYFMYLEDADICRRLHALGKDVLLIPSCTVVHDAQRASRKSWVHMRWHMASMLKFLAKNAF